MIEELLSLPECQARLKAAMGAQAPALVTLKRWSSDGKLKGAKVEARNGRHRYRYEAVQRMAQAAVQDSTSPRAKKDRLRSAEKAGIASTATVGDNPLILHTDDLEELKAYLAAIVSERTDAMLAELKLSLQEKALSEAIGDAVEAAMAKISKQVTDGLKTLDATRVAMMLKYDSVDAMRKDKVDALTAENDKLRRDASSLDVQRVASTLRQILDQLKDLGASQ